MSAKPEAGEFGTVQHRKLRDKTHHLTALAIRAHNWSMKRTRPTFAQATCETPVLLVQIHKALEAGILSARTFFDDKSDGDRPFEASLFAMLVRYRAKQVLDSAGTHAELDLELDALQNIGLKIRSGAYVVRIRLSPDLTVPLPRGSRALQEYYHNPCVIRLFNLDDIDQAVEEIDEPIKLVFVWRAAPPTFELQASLALPRQSTVDGDSVVVWWNERLPHPSTLMSIVETEGEVEDLPTRSTRRGDAVREG